MKIAYAHLYESSSGLGGADRGVLELVTGMRSKFQVDVRVILNEGTLHDELMKLSIPCEIIPHSKFRTYETILKFKKVLRDFHPDLIHSHHRYTTFLLDLFFKGKGVPILHTQRIENQDKRLLFRYGDYMTTVSKDLAQHMISFYGVPKEKVQAVVNAVSLPEPNLEVVESLQKQFPKSKENQLYALFPGRIDVQKGHIYLIKALSEMEASLRESIKIFIAGDGSLRQEIEHKAKNLKVDSSLVFLGYRKDLAELLAFSDFVLLPSLWEGMPRSVLESFFAGKPALATEIGGTKEVIQHQVNGWLAPSKNPTALRKALEYFIENPEKIREMGERALESSKHYTLDRVLNEYHDLYQKLIKSKND